MLQSGDNLKYFYTLKYVKINFFIFKILFLTSAYQNDLKIYLKNIIYIAFLIGA